MILEGYVKDKNNASIANALVEIKDDNFATIYSTESNAEGYYRFDIPARQYPYLVAVKDYAVNCLEYWCQNIPLQQNMSLDVSFDTLEVYGLHAFTVKGGGNSLMVYFRPMSLLKFQQGELDIAPEDISINVSVDGEERPILVVNKVKESAGDREMSAYLIQIETKGNCAWKKLDIQITDKDNQFGMATIFNDII